MRAAFINALWTDGEVRIVSEENKTEYVAEMMPEVHKQRVTDEQRKEKKPDIKAQLYAAEMHSGKLDEQLEVAKDRVEMLEAGMNLKSTTRSVHATEDADSLEIGTQKDGRVKVYGNFGNKKKFAEKLNTAIELTEAAREKMNVINGNGSEKTTGAK